MNENEDNLIDDEKSNSNYSDSLIDDEDDDENGDGLKKTDYLKAKDVNLMKAIEKLDIEYSKLNDQLTDLDENLRKLEDEKQKMNEEKSKNELMKTNKIRKYQYLTSLLSGNKEVSDELGSNNVELFPYVPPSPVEGLVQVTRSIRDLQTTLELVNNQDSFSNVKKDSEKFYRIRTIYLRRKIHFLFRSDNSYTFQSLLKEVAPVLIDNENFDYINYYFKDEKSDNIFPLHTPVYEAVEMEPSLSLILCDKSDMLHEGTSSETISIKKVKNENEPGVEDKLLKFLQKYENYGDESDDDFNISLPKKKDISQKASRKNELIFKIEKTIGNKICYLIFYVAFVSFLIYFISNKNNTNLDFNLNQAINSEFVDTKFKVPFLFSFYDDYSGKTIDDHILNAELSYKEIFNFRLYEYWLRDVFFEKIGFYDKSFSFLKKHKLIGKIRFMQIRQKEYQEGENKNCPLLFSHPEQIESRRSYICYDDYESNNDQEENDTFYYIKDLKNERYGNETEKEFFNNCILKENTNKSLCLWANEGLTLRNFPDNSTFNFAGYLTSYSVKGSHYFDLPIEDYDKNDLKNFAHMLSHFWLDNSTRLFTIMFTVYLSINTKNIILTISFNVEVGKAYLLVNTIQSQKYTPFINFHQKNFISSFLSEFCYIFCLAVFSFLTVRKLVRNLIKYKSSILYHGLSEFCLKFVTSLSIIANLLCHIIFIILEHFTVKKKKEDNWQDTFNINGGSTPIKVTQLIMIVLLISNLVTAFYPEFFTRIFFTIQKAFKYILSFFLIFGSLFFGFALSIKILISNNEEDFSSIAGCMSSMMTLIYSNYEKVFSIMDIYPGFILILIGSYVILANFTLLNIVYIIIYSAYEGVKSKHVLTLLDFKVVHNGIKQFVENIIFKLLKVSKLQSIKDWIQKK